MLDGAVATGMRVGIIARDYDAGRLGRGPCAPFPGGSPGQVTHALAMKHPDSQWHRQLSRLGGESPPSDVRIPYWLGPVRELQDLLPVPRRAATTEWRLSSSGTCVLGFGTFILDIPPNEEELEHTVAAFDRAWLRFAGAGAGGRPALMAAVEHAGLCVRLPQVCRPSLPAVRRLEISGAARELMTNSGSGAERRSVPLSCRTRARPGDPDAHRRLREPYRDRLRGRARGAPSVPRLCASATPRSRPDRNRSIFERSGCWFSRHRRRVLGRSGGGARRAPPAGRRRPPGPRAVSIRPPTVRSARGCRRREERRSSS